MSISLQKGQKVDLTKGNAKLKKVVVGLGWDQAEPQKKGFLGLGGKVDEIDCDASVIMCQAGGKVTGKSDVVFFGNLRHSSGCVNHMGDNLTGAGDGDDEQIQVFLLDLPSKYEKLVFVVNIYEAEKRKQHFGMIRNAFIRIVDADTNTELCKYNLTESYDQMTGMIFGEIYRHQNDWKFNAIGQGVQAKHLGEIIQMYA